MPFASDAQKRLMFAAAAGKSDKVPKKVAKKYIADSKGKPAKRHTAKPSKRRKGY